MPFCLSCSSNESRHFPQSDFPVAIDMPSSLAFAEGFPTRDSHDRMPPAGRLSYLTWVDPATFIDAMKSRVQSCAIVFAVTFAIFPKPIAAHVLSLTENRMTSSSGKELPTVEIRSGWSYRS